MMRMILGGALAGLALTALLAIGDSVIYQGYLFGLQTVIIGVMAGGFMLLLALGMSVASYLFATRGSQFILRRRLLAAAIFTGVAGVITGFSSVAIWALAGRPIFP